MTRTHAAMQLLAHGPLTFREFAAITGWPSAACRGVLSYLVDQLARVERMGGLYRIAHDDQLPDVPALAAQNQPADGPARVRPLCAGTAMGIPAAAADVRATQAGCCGCGRGADQVEREGVRV